MMKEPSADRDLLLVVLAAQLGLVEHHEVTDAVMVWKADRSRTLGDILAQKGLLAARDRQLLEPMIDRQIEIHGGSAAQSLGSMPAAEPLRDLLGLEELDADQEATSATGMMTSDAALPETMPFSRVTTPGDRFQILRLHAEGGLGRVSVALDRELNREVAFKEIRDKFAGDERTRARFVTEAVLTGGLEHPGIVPVYSLGEFEDGRPYYAMRLIRGDSLQKAIARHHRAHAGSGQSSDSALSLSKLLHRFIDVCYAVEYAHSRGVLHRDLKPANVMLGKFGETLVVDWGLAKAVSTDADDGIDADANRVPSSGQGSSITVIGSAVGTPQFMSPEQALGRLHLIGPKTDVYSLGATLFSILTGKPPIEGKTRAAVLAKTSRSEFPRPRQVNPRVAPALEAICLKAMARRLEDRYAKSRDVAEDVERWLADEPVSAYREPFLDTARRWARRHRLAVAVAAVLLVSVSLALGIGNVLVTRERDVARQERDKANVAKAAADKANRLAQQNAAATRQVVEQFLIKVGDDRWSEIPHFESVRIEMVQLAVQRYGALIKQQPRNLALIADAVMAYRRCANLYRMVGQFDQASALYAQAITMVRQIVAAQPENEEIRTQQINLLADAADLMLRHRGPVAAAPRYDEALTIAREIKNSQPESTAASMVFARVEIDYGEVLADMGDYPKALAVEHDAVSILRDQADSDPTNTTSRLLCVFASNTLGAIARKAGHLNEADRSLSESVRRGRSLLKLSPRNPNLRFVLAWAFLEQGTLRGNQGKQDEAMKLLSTALRALDQLAAEQPRVASFRRELAETRIHRGQLYLADQRPVSALQDAHEAVTLMESLNARSGEAAIYELPLLAAYHLRAAAHLKFGCHEKALQDVNAAFELARTIHARNPSNPELARHMEALDQLREKAQR